MEYLKTYEKFALITELVYMGKTIFSSYDFIANRSDNFGSMNIVLDTGESISLNIETYGKPGEVDAKSDEYILQVDHLSHRDDLTDIINTIVYIINKNKLGYVFSAKANKTNQWSTQVTYMLSINESINIIELEQIINTTKVVNAKIKQGMDLDKLIYLTR